MALQSCEREPEVRRMVSCGIRDLELDDHVTQCPVCRDSLQVTAWMQQFAAFPVTTRETSDPSNLRWKAELLRRMDAERRAIAPIAIGEKVEGVIGLIGAGALLFSLWHGNFITPTSQPMLVLLCYLAVVVATAALTIRRLTAK